MLFGVDSFEEFQQYLETFNRIKINGQKKWNDPPFKTVLYLI